MSFQSRVEGVRTQGRVTEVSWWKVPDDGACDGEGPTTKPAPVMSWHVEVTAAGGAKTLVRWTGNVGRQRVQLSTRYGDLSSAACTGEQSLRACTGPAQERPASATRCEVNVSGRGRTSSFG